MASMARLQMRKEAERAAGGWWVVGKEGKHAGAATRFAPQEKGGFAPQNPCGAGGAVWCGWSCAHRPLMSSGACPLNAISSPIEAGAAAAM